MISRALRVKAWDFSRCRARCRRLTALSRSATANSMFVCHLSTRVHRMASQTRQQGHQGELSCVQNSTCSCNTGYKAEVIPCPLTTCVTVLVLIVTMFSTSIIPIVYRSLANNEIASVEPGSFNQTGSNYEYMQILSVTLVCRASISATPGISQTTSSHSLPTARLKAL